MHGTTSGAAAVVLGQVDRQAEVDVLGVDERRLAVDLGERAVHRRVLARARVTSA